MFPFPGIQRIPALQFGRRQPFTWPRPGDDRLGQSLADDARLFLTTFAGGLLFMTIYLG